MITNAEKPQNNTLAMVLTSPALAAGTTSIGKAIVSPYATGYIYKWKFPYFIRKISLSGYVVNSPAGTEVQPLSLAHVALIFLNTNGEIIPWSGGIATNTTGDTYLTNFGNGIVVDLNKNIDVYLDNVYGIQIINFSAVFARATVDVTSRCNLVLQTDYI